MLVMPPLRNPKQSWWRLRWEEQPSSPQPQPSCLHRRSVAEPTHKRRVSWQHRALAARLRRLPPRKLPPSLRPQRVRSHQGPWIQHPTLVQLLATQARLSRLLVPQPTERQRQHRNLVSRTNLPRQPRNPAKSLLPLPRRHRQATLHPPASPLPTSTSGPLSNSDESRTTSISTRQARRLVDPDGSCPPARTERCGGAGPGCPTKAGSDESGAGR